MLNIYLFLLFPIIYAIYVPSHNESKNALKTLGIKTIDWQEQTTATPLIIHQSYSTVHKQQHQNAKNLEDIYENNRIGNNPQPIYAPITTERPLIQNYHSGVQRNKPKRVRQVYTKCPTNETGQFAYEYTCNQFLNCWNGHGYVQNCAPGTLFNPVSLECDLADKVECLNGARRARLSEPLKNKPQASCPQGFSGIIPHYSDCSKFINCDNGRDVPTNCPPGTLFDYKSNVCDFPANCLCANGEKHYLKSRPVEPSLRHFGGTPSKQNILHDNNQATTAKCPTGFTGLQAHPTDCAKFLNCANGRTYIQNCGPGTVFNPLTKVCDFPSNVKCGQSNYVPPPPSPKPIPTQRPAASNYQYVSVKPNYMNINRTMCRQGYSGQNCLIMITPDKGTPAGQANPLFISPDPLPPPKQYPQRNFTILTKPHQGTSGNFWSPNREPIGNYPQRNYTVISKPQYPSIPEQYPQGSYNPQSNYPVQTNPQYYPSGKDIPDQQRNYPNPFTPQQPYQPGQSTYQPTPTYPSNKPQTNYPSTYQPNYPPNPQANYPTNPQANYPSNPQTDFPSKPPANFPSKPPTNYPSNPQTNFASKPPANFPSNPQPNYPSNSQSHYPTNPQFTSEPSYPSNKQNYPPYNPPKYNATLVPNYHQSNPYEESLQGASTNYYNTTEKPNRQWPPPFPSTDTNADYVFEYEDIGNEADLGSPNIVEKNWCDFNGFECGYKVCIAPGSVCNDIKDCPNGKDELDCNRGIGQFSRIPNTKLAVKETDKLQNITLKWCAIQCIDKNCKAFNYRLLDNCCFLLQTNVGESGALIIMPNYDYYENKQQSVLCTNNQFVCRNQKCIQQAQLCDGMNDCGDWMDEKNCKAEKFGYKTRLAGSDYENAGRIVVEAFGRTGYVCDDMFGYRSADVACRELGFPLGALEIKGNSFFAQDLQESNTFYMMDDVTCLGNETRLLDCDFNGWGVHNCKDQEIVGVICKIHSEECPEDSWMCANRQQCLQLPFVCDGIPHCGDKSDEGPQCNAKLEVRLVNGTSHKSGRVEIKYNNIWGTVCDDDFNDDAGKVVCNQLGYKGSAIVKKDAYFGPGKGPIWLDQVICKGYELTLGDCEHWEWSEHNCDHNEDVSVICTDIDIPGKQRHLSVNTQDMKQDDDGIDENFNDTLPETCGLRKDALFQDNSDVHFRVVQGSRAQQGEYPWQASLRIRGKFKSSHWCGAVIISKRLVLTAAHCLNGFSKGAYFIVAGDYNVDNDEGTEQQAYIEDFIIHENFGKINKVNNDIALIRLKGRGFNLNKDVQAICLPDPNTVYQNHMNCTISGFGSIENGKSRASKDLRAGWVPIQPNTICTMPHIYGDAITPGMFCAGSLEEGVDACDGDSGGPLACLDNGLFTLYGITSWGQHCGYANKPGVYVNVAYYRNWIEEAIKKLNN